MSKIHYVFGLCLSILSVGNYAAGAAQCLPLPSLDTNGQYVGLQPQTYTIKAGDMNACTPYIDLMETNYCGTQQVQAYAYIPKTSKYAQTEYVRVFVDTLRDAVADDKGAYTAHTFLQGDHVSGKAMACTSLQQGVEAVDLTLKVIYWP